ncbi:MAG: glycoside hydrolase family 38 C-terminal domain-containing protein [Acidobacteriota bacterium]
MKNSQLLRRDFVKLGVLGGAGVLLPARSSHGFQKPSGICLALASHWSYIGIGWQLGLESCVLSVIDAMGMADRPPGVKTCINLDAHAYELMAQRFPEVSNKLKRYLDQGKVELIGGTFAQPMGSYISGESNIRQLVCGKEAIRKALNHEIVTFLEEEEFTHPQLPQLLAATGFRYASLAQVDTWGKAGIPILEMNVFQWQGKDGTTIPCIPKNSLFSYGIQNPASIPALRKLQELGKPLMINWAEFGWESHDEPAYLVEAEKYRKLAEEYPIEFVTLREYMEKHGTSVKETIYLDMDAWRKLLPWGIGGDQLRILDRKVEGTLLAAERFEAIAQRLGAKPKQRELQKAWKDLLAGQSHDVALCEYSRWQSDRMAPLDRSEDFHNFSWGVIGFNHIDAAQKRAQPILEDSVKEVSARVNSASNKAGDLAVTVFNPSGWERSEVVVTGRLFPRAKAKGVVVRTVSGRVLPSQMVRKETDAEGYLVFADVAFRAANVPAVGYDTYYLEFLPEPGEVQTTGLKYNEENLEMENEYLKLRLGPSHGAIASLVEKKTAREMIEGQQGPFPVFRGHPNTEYPLRGAFIRGKYSAEELKIPAEFNSFRSGMVGTSLEARDSTQQHGDWRQIQKSSIRWIEKGPLRATVKASHYWPLLKFETYVSLHSESRYVEVTSRVLAEIPPALDKLDEKGRFPTEIKEGYWLSFTPAFPVSSVLRDFPFGLEPTTHRGFHALTLVDLLAEDTGLLLLHSGTQYFSRDDGLFSNLVMREWESFFTGEFGWPRYAEYRHGLWPHDSTFSHAQRLQASAEFAQKMTVVVGKPVEGPLPKRQSFVSLKPGGVQLSALRAKSSSELELRLVEVEGHHTTATITLNLPLKRVAETDLLGDGSRSLSAAGNEFSSHLPAWRVQTFSIR